MRLLACLLLAACGHAASPAIPAAPAAPGPPPSAAPVPDHAAARFPWVGVVAPRAAVDVEPRREGRLVEVLVRLGDHVHAGDVLARLDDRASRRALDTAGLALAVARADARAQAARLRSARDRSERIVLMAGAASEAERVDGALASQEAAALLQAARARSAQAALDAAQRADDLRDAELVAPFDGVVAVRYLDAGALTGPNLPVLRLVDPGEPRLRFGVPPVVGAGLREGIAVETSTGSTALVQRVAPSVDAPSGLVFVEARLDRDTVPTETGAMVRVALVSRGRP